MYIKNYNNSGIRETFMKRKVVKIFILLIMIILLFILLFVGTKFFEYKDIIGGYKLVSGTYLEEILELKLFNWNM